MNNKCRAILTGDEIYLDLRIIYEFLTFDHKTFLVTGHGGNYIPKKGISVAYRIYK